MEQKPRISGGTDAPDRIVLKGRVIWRLWGVDNPVETEVDISRPLVLLLTCFWSGAWFRPTLFLQSISSIQPHGGKTGIDREGVERRVRWSYGLKSMLALYFCRLKMGQTREKYIQIWHILIFSFSKSLEEHSGGDDDMSHLGFNNIHMKDVVFLELWRFRNLCLTSPQT